ncbi:MAG: hypothetical protein P8I83_11690 [Paracoccaceae bacterium]|nr:hypothetical protein [Paracoccaceae bacterium]
MRIILGRPVFFGVQPPTLDTTVIKQLALKQNSHPITASPDGRNAFLRQEDSDASVPNLKFIADANRAVSLAERLERMK